MHSYTDTEESDLENFLVFLDDELVEKKLYEVDVSILYHLG